jgi:hypothetical protein
MLWQVKACIVVAGKGHVRIVRANGGQVNTKTGVKWAKLQEAP